MSLRFPVWISVFAILEFFLSGCDFKTVAPPEIPAEKISFAGHGLIFDKNMKDIILTDSLIAEIQNSMLDEILKNSSNFIPKDKIPTINQANDLLSSKDSTEDEKILIKSGIIGIYLNYAPEKLVLAYKWRNKALISHFLKPKYDIIYKLPKGIFALLTQLDFFIPSTIGNTNYIADCRVHDVPIPPDWAESGTDWVRQGNLTENLLEPGGNASVWTYSDPVKRGGCIALPRGDGSVGSPAGIICQSATTGHACIWDNKKQGVEPEQFLGWSGKRLIISELKNASNLDSTCTSCHHGNNVFLISPDDTTWAKVLRGPLSGSRTGTFTTRVEVSSDNRDGHPRYIPITTLPERLGWENILSSPGCSGGCHESATVRTPRPMPPRCAATSTDPSNCYGNP